MTIPSKFNPFGISKNNAFPTDGLVFYAPLQSLSETAAETGQSILNKNTGNRISENIIGTIPCLTATNMSARYYWQYEQTGLPFGNSDRTVSVWLYLKSTNKFYSQIVKYGISRPAEYSWMRIFRQWVDVAYYQADFNSITNNDLNKWFHLTYTFEHTENSQTMTIKLYVNGVYSQTESQNVNTVDNGYLYIFSSDWEDGTLEGSISSLRIYNRVLSQKEITQLANEFHPIYEITASDQEYTFSPVSSSSKSIVYSTDGGTVNSFEIISGSLPSNISFNTSTGTFTGIATTDADHTYNLVIKLSGPDVIAKTINYTVKTSATSTLTATSPQTFNFTTESQERVKFTCTRENEQVIGTIYSGSLPSGMILVGVSKDLYIQSGGNQTEAVNTSLVVGLTTNYHPEPVYVTCNVNLALNQISASNQAFTFYSADGVKTKQIQYTSQKTITPVYSLSGTLPSGVTFDSTSGIFTSDGTQTIAETKVVQLTISSSTGCSAPAVIDVTLNVEIGESPIPDDYVFYASLSSVVNTAETGQSLSYRNSTPSATVDGIDCLYFNNNSGIYSTSTTGMPTGTSPWTMSIWAYILDINRSSVALSMGTTSSYRSPYFGYHGTTKNYLYGTWGWDVTTNTTAKLNTWVNFILTYDGTTVKFYADNELIASENKNLNVQYGGIYIGSHCNYYNIFYGYLARARIYNRVLSDSEISKLSNEFKTFIEIPDQTINFDASQGVETKTISYSTNITSGIVFGLSGTLPTGITFDSTSGSFTSDGTQTANESSDVIVSALYADKNISTSASVGINVFYNGPVMPTSGLIFHASLSSVVNTAETGQSLSYHNSPSATVIDGLECLYFDSTDGISTTDIENLPSGNSPFTASMWVCMKDLSEITSDANKNNVAFSFGNPSFYASPFFGWHGGTSGYFYGTWGRDLYTRITPNYNVWTNLMLTYDGSTLKFYLNGNVIASSTFNINVSYGGLYIGSHCDRNYFYGYLRDARLYNRVLTDDEMSLLVHEFDVTNPIITDSLTMYMPMKDNLNAFIGTPLSSVMTNPPTATVEDGIKCYYFDGSNCLYGDDASYFTTFNSSDAPHCTLCYWFKYDTTSQLERYTAQIGYQDNDYSACIHYNYIWGDGPQICQSQAGHWTEPLILGSEAANGWHLYVIRVQTWDFGEGEYWIYQDGYVNSTEYEGSGRGASWGNFCMHPMIAIGGQVSLTNHSTGNIDCIKGWYTGIRMYNKVLSAEEIAAIAAEFPTSN